MVKNLFLQTCEVLNIPYTQTFTNRTFNEHPYKYSLFGLSRMLTDYGVENCGLRFSDKAATIAELETPFVAQLSGDLSLVTSISADSVTYRWYDDTVHVSRGQFINLWSGVALIVAPDEDSCEPHYKEHRRKEHIQQFKKWGAVGSIAILLFLLFIRQAYCLPSLLGERLRVGALAGMGLGVWLTLLILNIAGLYLSYLLLLRQLKIASSTADRLCNLLKHSTCTDLLDTPAAKAAFGISWSEIGAAYFCVNTIALLLFPESLPIIGLFSFASLGYTIWSIWYQRFRAHTWCALCLLVQAIFILQSITYLLYILHSASYLSSLGLSLGLGVFIFVFYFAATLTLHLSLPVISKARQAEEWRSDYRNFKLKREVFDALLNLENHYDVEATSHILFGNPDAPYRLTILTNPYCNPCATMHARVKGIRQTDCCVNMVFSSFGEEYDRVCCFMIAAYQQLGPDRAWQVYEEWYSGGKSRQEAFFDGLGLDAEAEAVQTEYEQHKTWRRQTGFSATPTLLVNGYRMPKSYSIEDFNALINICL